MEKKTTARLLVFRRIRNASLWVIAAAFVVLAASALYLLGAMYLSRPVESGRLIGAQLGKAVSISRDENGLVLIDAADRKDLIFALGFVHAQERFFQMDVLRRTAAGELSALLGERALDSDRKARLHRFRNVAERAVATLPADQLQWLEAYTQGVNYGVRQLATKPFEYSLLRASPQKWRREDSLLVQMTMYILLQSQQDRNHPEIIRRVLERAYDREAADFLFAAGTEWDTPLDGQPSLGASVPPPSLLFSQTERAVSRNVDASAYARTVIGSNSWAVSGERTRDHRAIIANDVHLPLQMPNTLFRVAMKLAGRDRVIAGVSIPGTLLMAGGSNGHIAWGVTNSNGDWSDIVPIDRNDRQLIQTRHEKIEVKGGASIEIAIEESRWGPIVDRDDRYAYALDWVAQHVEGNNLSFVSLLTADTLEDAAHIAASSGIPHMNLLVVDEHGSAMWTIAGRIPKRTGFTGEQTVAWSDTVGWDGWLAPQDYPVRFAKDQPYLWTANNRVVSGADAEKIGQGSQFALGVRARRIRDALAGSPVVDERHLHRMQLNIDALLMRRWHELTLKVAGMIEESAVKAELQEVLRRWDGKAAAGSAAYRIVRRFRDEIAGDVMPQLMTKFLSARADTQWFEALPDWETPLWRVLSTQPEKAVPAGSKSWNQYLRDTLVADVYKPYKEKYGSLDRAVWGEANQVSITHPLSAAIPFLGSLLDMPSSPMDGDTNVIDAQLWSFGPAMRMVVSPGHEADAVLTMPGGQAGNPFSPYYGRGHERWAHGEPLPLLPQQPKYVLKLVPAATEL